MVVRERHVITHTSRDECCLEGVSLDDVMLTVERLAQEFPGESTPRILSVFVSSLGHTRDAKVQGFRLLLAERRTRQQLST